MSNITASQINAAWDYTFMHLTEGLIIFDVETRSVIEANEKAAYLIGVPRPELMGMSISAFMAHPDVDESIGDAVLDAIYHKERFNEKIVASEVKEIGRRDIRLRSSLLRSEELVIGIIIFLEDVTDLTELKKELVAMEKIRNLNRQLEMRNEYIRKVFGEYMSDTLLTELLDKPDGADVLAKEANVTVLMSDLRGFTAACAQTPPQLMFDALNHYLTLMTEEINRNHGLIIELLGDGILAVFGAPRESENHAADAVAAAICMQNALEKANEWNRAHGMNEFAMGIGISTGKMFVGNIGSEQRKKYCVMGSSVNLCGRIESYSTAGDILISPETRAMIRIPMEIDKELEVLPKGVTSPITISRVRSLGGSYSLSENFRGELEFTALKKALEIAFRPISGKHVSAGSEKGYFTALCASAGLFETEAELSLYDNVDIDIGAQLFGKVTEKDGKKYTVQFTAKPANFDTWLNDRLKE